MAAPTSRSYIPTVHRNRFSVAGLNASLTASFHASSLQLARETTMPPQPNDLLHPIQRHRYIIPLRFAHDQHKFYAFPRALREDEEFRMPFPEILASIGRFDRKCHSALGGFMEMMEGEYGRRLMISYIDVEVAEDGSLEEMVVGLSPFNGAEVTVGFSVDEAGKDGEEERSQLSIRSVLRAIAVPKYQARILSTTNIYHKYPASYSGVGLLRPCFFHTTSIHLQQPQQKESEIAHDDSVHTASTVSEEQPPKEESNVDSLHGDSALPEAEASKELGPSKKNSLDTTSPTLQKEQPTKESELSNKGLFNGTYTFQHEQSPKAPSNSGSIHVASVLPEDEEAPNEPGPANKDSLDTTSTSTLQKEQATKEPVVPSNKDSVDITSTLEEKQAPKTPVSSNDDSHNVEKDPSSNDALHTTSSLLEDHASKEPSNNDSLDPIQRNRYIVDLKFLHRSNWLVYPLEVQRRDLKEGETQALPLYDLDIAVGRLSEKAFMTLVRFFQDKERDEGRELMISFLDVKQTPDENGHQVWDPEEMVVGLSPRKKDQSRAREVRFFIADEVAREEYVSKDLGKRVNLHKVWFEVLPGSLFYRTE
ncbi:hypothetical protein BJ508DRAFT_324744 [Ascobolus immersus RN42]|uniref:Uncharacterized protein n=1 Tax=Ascobolus immersus RN42 TaxID=1160509 RepID=A0A3N4IG91_ASCIM|nr:hypothetical protein BJ508DRAFT_324744 [Ascobolus immersus RN42]